MAVPFLSRSPVSQMLPGLAIQPSKCCWTGPRALNRGVNLSGLTSITSHLQIGLWRCPLTPSCYPMVLFTPPQSISISSTCLRPEQYRINFSSTISTLWTRSLSRPCVLPHSIRHTQPQGRLRVGNKLIPTAFLIVLLLESPPRQAVNVPL